MRRRDSPSTTRVTTLDMLDGDGVEGFVFGGPGPCRTLVEAAAAWERLRVATWERWAAERAGAARGPCLDPPYAAVTHDALSNEASHSGYPVAGFAAHALRAVDADLEALAAFQRARPAAAESVAGPLDIFRCQLNWLADVATSAGDDRHAAEQLLYGSPPNSKESPE